MEDSLVAQDDVEPQEEGPINLAEALAPITEEQLPEVEEDQVLFGGEQQSVDDFLRRTQHKVEMYGEEVEVPYEELITGYQRGADSSRKAEELSKAKEDIWPYTAMVAYAKEDPAFVAHVRTYFSKTPAMDAVSDPELRISDGELAQMMQHDPSRAAHILAKRDTWLRQSEARKQTDARVQQQKRTMMAEALKGSRAAAQQNVDTAYGKGTYEKDLPAVQAYLRDAGVTEDELRNLWSPHLQRIAFDAYQQEKRKQAGAKLNQKRKPLKPPKAMTSGVARSRSPGKLNQRKSLQKAVKTQKTEDWVNYIEKRIK